MQGFVRSEKDRSARGGVSVPKPREVVGRTVSCIAAAHELAVCSGFARAKYLDRFHEIHPNPLDATVTLIV